MGDLELCGAAPPGTRPAGTPDAVLVGDLGERWTYALLQEAFEYLMAGAGLIALSRDRYWLEAAGSRSMPGRSWLGWSLRSGRSAVVAGKPSPAFYAAALRSMGLDTPGSVAMVGDDLWSDVQGAQRAGLQGWLVRTGKYREAVLAKRDQAGPDPRQHCRLGVTTSYLPALPVPVHVVTWSSVAASASSAVRGTPASASTPGPDCGGYRFDSDPSLIIRGVQLQRRDIFDPNERAGSPGWPTACTSGPSRRSSAEELLVRTVGSPMTRPLVAESERNLRAMGIFRRVQIDTVRTPEGLMLRVETKDGWSTQADWRFRSTGGEVAFTIGLVENNLLGTASAAAVRYRKDPDRSSVALSFRRPRLFAGSLGWGWRTRTDPTAASAGLALDSPFYRPDLHREPFASRPENRDERVLQFRDGVDVASDTL